MSERERYQSFLRGCSVFLGAFMGCLVAVPVTSTSLRPVGAPILLFAILFGGVAGFRHRDNRAFLYFCLVGILILATLISFSMLEPPAT